mmetsp:Transcript_3692/g.7873  ORF Transcript_3692/g.7873 Transcript_3692/m.7873 type:complete len:214 (+) Transcript_3692:394-1035(+)
MKFSRSDGLSRAQAGRHRRLSPALHRSIVSHSQRMREPRSDRHNIPQSTGDFRLAVVIASPRHHVAISRHRQRVMSAGGHRPRFPNPGRDRRLSVHVVAPTHNFSIVAQREGVAISGSDRLHLGQAFGDRMRPVAEVSTEGDHRPVALEDRGEETPGGDGFDVGRRTAGEFGLVVVVVAPSDERAIGRESEAVFNTRRHRSSPGYAHVAENST